MVNVSVRFIQGLNTGVREIQEQFETREGAEAYVEMVLAKGVRIELPEGHMLIVPPQRVLEIEVWVSTVSTDGETDKRIAPARLARAKPSHRKGR